MQQKLLSGTDRYGCLQKASLKAADEAEIYDLGIVTLNWKQWSQWASCKSSMNLWVPVHYLTKVWLCGRAPNVVCFSVQLKKQLANQELQCSSPSRGLDMLSERKGQGTEGSCFGFSQFSPAWEMWSWEESVWEGKSSSGPPHEQERQVFLLSHCSHHLKC